MLAIDLVPDLFIGMFQSPESGEITIPVAPVYMSSEIALIGSPGC